MKKLPKIVIISIIAALTLITASSFAEDSFTYPKSEHKDVSYEEIMSMTYDESAMTALLADFENAVQTGSASDESEIEELYGKLVKEFDHLSTAYSVLQIKTSMDPANDSISSEFEEAELSLTNIQDELYGALRDASKSDMYKRVMKKLIPAEQWESLLDYEDMTDEQMSIREQIAGLQTDYWAAMAENFSADYNGNTYTSEDLNDMDEDMYYDVLPLITKKENERVADIYRQIVKKDNELAASYGYDSYAEYAYKSVYGRDYDIDEKNEFERYVREYLVPLNLVLSIYQSDSGSDVDGYFTETSGRDRVEKLGSYISKVSPALTEAYEYMKNNVLYDIDKSDAKADEGYTTGLPEFGGAFIYFNSNGSMNDWSTLVHEFGHYNNFYHVDTPDIWASSCIDVSEIQSQGLEMLFLPHWGELLGNNDAQEDIELKQIFNMMSSVIQGCMVDEMERWAHENPDATVDEINHAFAVINSSYGYSNDGEADGKMYYWVEIGHLFDAQMYYISYAISAFGAFEIWEQHQKDPGRATETYLKISAMSDESYVEALGDAGLRDPFSERAVSSLCDQLTDFSKDRGWYDEQWMSNARAYIEQAEKARDELGFTAVRDGGIKDIPWADDGGINAVKLLIIVAGLFAVAGVTALICQKAIR